MPEEQKADMKTITVRVPKELHQQARLLSVQCGESLNSIITLWLTRWIESDRRRRGIVPSE